MGKDVSKPQAIWIKDLPDDTLLSMSDEVAQTSGVSAASNCGLIREAAVAYRGGNSLDGSGLRLPAH